MAEKHKDTCGEQGGKSQGQGEDSGITGGGQGGSAPRVSPWAHRLSPETRVVPFPRLEKGGWSKGRRKGGEGRQARRPGLRGPRRRKLSEGGKPEAETGQKEREGEREDASRSRCLEKHRLC